MEYSSVGSRRTRWAQAALLRTTVTASRLRSGGRRACDDGQPIRRFRPPCGSIRGLFLLSDMGRPTDGFDHSFPPQQAPSPIRMALAADGFFLGLALAGEQSAIDGFRGPAAQERWLPAWLPDRADDVRSLGRTPVGSSSSSFSLCIHHPQSCFKGLSLRSFAQALPFVCLWACFRLDRFFPFSPSR
jgi:hypothetical protein